jgi:hypothetical protein
MPNRYPDLRDRLVSDHPTIFKGKPDLATEFLELAQRLSLINQIK